MKKKFNFVSSEPTEMSTEMLVKSIIQSLVMSWSSTLSGKPIFWALKLEQIWGGDSFPTSNHRFKYPTVQMKVMDQFWWVQQPGFGCCKPLKKFLNLINYLIDRWKDRLIDLDVSISIYIHIRIIFTMEIHILFTIKTPFYNQYMSKRILYVYMYVCKVLFSY